MKYCEKCKVKISDPRERCPLCQSELTKLGDGNEERTFPYIPTVYKRNSGFLRILLFLSIICGLVCLLINYKFPIGIWWSLIVILGLLYMWSNILTGIRSNRYGIGKRILQQMVSLGLVLIGIDLLTGFYRWSFNYVLPILFISALLAITISSKLMGIRLQFFAIYLLIDGLFGIIPLIFIFTGLCTVWEPSALCVIISVLSFVSVFIFADENTRGELKRRFHV